MSSRATRSFQPVAPESYLDLAIELSGDSGEASRRSSIDRAYYAAFLAARDELTHKGYTSVVQGPDTHIQVALALTTVDSNHGRRLRFIRRARNRLTYETGSVSFPNGPSIGTVLDSARLVIDAVRVLPQNSR